MPLKSRLMMKLLILLLVLLLLQSQFMLSTIVTITGIKADVFAQSEAENNTTMSMNKQDNIISPLTEWVGVFALGITAGLVSTLRYKSNNSKSTSIRIIIISIVILSMSAGIIHLLLIQEHMEESFIWGISFLISGIAQIIYSIFIIIVAEKVSPLNNKWPLYYFGIAGNALLVGIFVMARLFTPPFSSEAAPINELEPNGIITIITEIFLIVLLAYLIKSSSRSQRSQKIIQ
jgi:hypothetical protein